MASLLRDLPLRGILIYVSNTFCFSLISFLVKELSEEFRVAELLLVRFFCTFLGLVVLIQFRGGFYILKTRKTLDLAIRSGAGMIAIAAHHKYLKGIFSDQGISPSPRMEFSAHTTPRQ